MLCGNAVDLPLRQIVNPLVVMSVRMCRRSSRRCRYMPVLPDDGGVTPDAAGRTRLQVPGEVGTPGTAASRRGRRCGHSVAPDQQIQYMRKGRTPGGVRPFLERVVSGPAAADGAVRGRHVAAGRLHLLPVGVGLLVDHLEVATQLGDELLAGHRTLATPEVTGSKHIADDGLVLLLQRSGLVADHRTVGVDVAELVVNAHQNSP